VYVAGNEGTMLGKDSIAKLWINDVVHNLSDVYSSANFVFVSGDNVYVAGNECGKAVLWKNGIAQNLTDRNYPTWASSIYVSDNGVYVAGAEYCTQKWIARLWKNGVVQDLAVVGKDQSWAHSVYVLGNDVYVAGYEKNRSKISVAKLWKNGVVQDLTYYTSGIRNAEARSVFVKYR